MIDLTPREKERAAAVQGPGTGICLALAELELYWENHRKNAPGVHELRMNIRIAAEGSTEDRIAAVQAIADWLGVEKHERHGCHIAQRRFGTGEDSVIVEAHYTPEPAKAVIARQDAARLAELVA
jgi:hypothetical protein